MRAGHLVGADGIGVDDGDQPGRWVAGIFLGMEAADMSGTDDGAANGLGHGIASGHGKRPAI